MKKKKFHLEGEKFPLIIDEVIEPNLNNHGIYALVKLNRLTEIEMGAKYAVTPLSLSHRPKHKAIKEDLLRARELAGPESDNIAFLPIDSNIIKNSSKSM